MNKTPKCFAVAFLASVVAVFLPLSCSDHAGLGNSVDTEAPKITISSPSAGDAVSGTFTLQGTCSDDIAVTSIPVSIRNTSSSESVSLGYATISEDGDSWSIQVNAYDTENADYDAYNGWQFCDGTYEISVTAYDGSGHSSDTVARSFDIDNTAPVFAITSPNSLNISDPATYGRSVSVVGEIADDHSISSMDIRLFRYDGGISTEITENLAQSSFSGFDTAGGTSVKIAQFYTESTASQLVAGSDEYNLYKNYCAMYDGAEEGEDAYLYAVITLTDTAGNTSDRTYIKSKLGALVKEATGLTSTPETADYKKILNGTYSSTLITEEQQAIIKQILTEDSYDQSELETTYAYLAKEAASDDETSARLAMSVNSDNAPRYEIVGYALDTESWGQTGSGSTINIKVTAGLDGTYVLPNTLAVQLYRSSDIGEKYNSTPDYTSENGDITITNSNGKSVAELDTSVSTATYIITLPQMKSSYYYLVEATGEDEDGNALSSDDVYGFTVTSTGNAPDLEADDKQWVKASALSTSADSVYTLPVTITDPLSDIATATSDTNYSGQGVSYTITVYGKYISSKNYLSAASSSILYTSESATLTGSAITAVQGVDNTYTADIPVSFDLDAYSADNYTVAVTVSALNSEESCSSTYIIWGDNKAPELSLTNSELLDEDGAVLTSGVVITENSSYYTANEDGTATYTVKGKWSDEDGSSTATLYYSTQADAAIGDGSWTAFSSDDAPQTTDAVKWSDDFTVTEGSGQSFSFYAEDEVGNVSDVLSVSGINFDFAVPVIALNSVSSPVNTAVTISGTVTDTNAIASDTVSVTITAPDGATAPTVTKTTASDGLSVTYTASVDASTANNGSWTVAVSATDAAGRAATAKSQSFVLDTVAPVFVTNNTSYPALVNSKSYDSTNAWYSSTALTISGCYSEALSGIAAVYYQVITPSATQATTLSTTNYTSAVATANGTTAATDVSSFATTAHDGGIASYSATISGFEASSTANMLRLVAVDAAGNASAVQSYAVYVDQESPTLSCSSHSGAQYTNGVTTITVSGTASDSSSGIASVTLAVSGSTVSVSASLGSADSSGNRSWTATLPTEVLSNLADSTYNVNATVTDVAGNASASTIFTLQKDTDAPAVSMTTPTASSTINGSISVQGTVSYDGATPASLTLYCSPTAPISSTTLSSLTQIGETITTASSIYSWTFSDVDVKTLSSVTETSPSASLYLIPVVTDTAGNCNVYTTASDGTVTYSFTSGTNYFAYTVDQNSDRPIIQLTSMDNADSWLSSKTLKGTVSDDDGIESLAISQDGSTYIPVTVTNGSWTYDITGGDSASILLYFKVTDTAGTTFTTAASSLFARPYYLYSGTASSDYQSVNSWTDYGFDAAGALSVKLDTANPQVYTLGLAIAKSYADYSTSATDGLVTAATVASDSASYAISSSRYAGGDSKYFKVYVPLYEVNISNGSVVVSIADASTSTDETASYSYVSDTSAGTVSAITGSSVALSATDTTITQDSIVYTYYETKPIVCESATSGLKTLTVTVTDAAGNVTTSSANFYVDNTGPNTITVTSPASTDEITGTTTITGTASDSGIGISNIEWLIPPASYTSSTTDAVLNALDGWVSANNTGSAGVFKFKFTSGSTYDLTNYDSEENYAVTYDSENLLYTIPVFFRTTDSLGNTYIDRTYYITHNPDGDRPVTAVSYPTESDYDEDSDGATLGYVTLAGTIRVNGTVEIPSATVDVGQVYIQIGTVASDGTETWTSDNSAIAAEITTLGGVVTPTATTTDGTTTYAIGDEYTSTTYVDSTWWGIAATTKTSTWNISLNTNGNLDPSSSSDTTNIAIRACAINADGKMGNWTDTYYIHVDSNAPSQTSEMRQYSSFSSAALDENVSTTKDYASEMYLKGTWYLVVTLNDNDSLKYDTIKVKKGSASTTFYASSYADLTDETNGVTNTLYIPIETETMTSSSVSYTVYAEDTSGHSSSMTYTFYIDNAAPTLGTVSGNGDELSEESENAVAESNYVYTLSGTVKDTASGYDKVAFYFLRDGTIYGTENTFGTSYILDPLVTDWSKTDDAKIAFSGLTLMSSVTGEASDVLYAAKATATSGITASTTDGTTYYSFTDSGSVVSGNNHIHAGGLIYAGGAYGLITSVDGSTVTFTSDATPTGEKTVYFPYAQVVDNTSTEDVASTTANPFTFNSGDDGDLMPETITNVSTTWTWKATIHSSNIPDGPAYLVVVAYDAAGNVSTVTYPVSVTNSAPRLAKLYLATDLNSDGSFAQDEFSEYNVYTADEDAGVSTAGYKTSATITTAKFDAGQFTAKDKLAVVPEITGGNGSLYMVYKRGASDTTAVTGTADGTADGTDSSGAQLVSTTTLDAATSTSASYLGVLNSGDSLEPFALTSAQVWQDLTADPTSATGVSFTFWDSTEERTAGTNSQNCVVYITDMLIDLADGESPTNKITPFYWTSASENSLYGNSTANGHIELGAGELGTSDIPTAISGSSGLNYGDDPKVSGKIKITGTAYDNKMLQKITLKADGFSFNGGTAGDDFDFATYSGSAWTLTSGSLSSTAGGAIASDGWQFSVDSSEITQSGHTVTWTLYLDTEKHANVAAKDVAVVASATDFASKTQQGSDNASESSSTQTTKDTQTCYYQMDIVPYIAGVKTSLSSLKKANSSVYDRTALGHYPTASTGTVYIYGFNLSGGTLYDSAATANSASLTATTASSQSWYSSSAVPSGSVYTVGSIASFTSGEVYVENGATGARVQSLNNVNSDSASGSYTTTTTSTTGDYTVYANYYNRKPNNDSNNLLTDDVVLDVWAFDSDAVVPISGKIEQPHMAIDPVTGQIGFAFVNGPLYFSMAGSTESSTKTSYDYWMGSYDFFTSVGFAYDSLGYTYGVAAGGDINSASADKFQFMTSRWGRASLAQNGSYSSSNSLRLESIGMQGTKTDTADTTYYFDKQRIKSPSLVTAVHDTDTNVYLAYYDAMNDEIRFKAGGTDDGDVFIAYSYMATTTSDAIHLTASSAVFSAGDTIYLLDENYQLLTETSYTVSNFYYNGSNNDYVLKITDSNANSVWLSYIDNLAYVVKTDDYAVSHSFVDYDTAGAPYVYRNGTVSIIAGDGTSYGAGSYVSLGVIPGSSSTTDVVVAVWYDETSRVLYYSYNTTPLTNRNGVTDRTGWSTPVQVFSGDMANAGEYCQLAVDTNRGIHIAAYDSVNCDLVYAYLSSYKATPVTCVVDSSGVVGSNLTIDVALDSNNNAIPRIGYYATSCVRPKLAYRVDTSSTAPAGASDDAFTGAWECAILPTSSSVSTQSNQYNKMNVGVWKDASTGVVTSSTSGTSTYTNDANSYSSTSYGFVYGNGTSNAVMGYAIKVSSSTDAIETAQMQ